MVDTLTPLERSQRMSLIRSKDTKPELVLRSALHRRGLRYRLHAARLPGKPDIVFSGPKFLVFVNGCFWHGHKCPTGHVPKTNSVFWAQKITANRARDARNIKQLRAMGWKVSVVWECRLRTALQAENIADGLSRALQSRKSKR